MFEPIPKGKSIRCFCLFLTFVSFQGFQLAWSQQTPKFQPSPTALRVENPVAVATFAEIPIVASQQRDESSSAPPRIHLRWEHVSFPSPKASPQTKPPQAVPTILGNTRPVSVSLNFLVVSSLSTRKALVSFRGGVVVEPTTRLDFDISNQARQIALSQFDPNIAAFLVGNDINRPDNSFFGPGLQQQNKIDQTELSLKMNKIWQNGLKSSIGYEPSLAYLYFPQGNAGSFNPAHSSDLVTRLEQPLLRGAGREVNLVNLRVVDWRAQQSLCEIEIAVQAQLRSIEQVYWRLHAEFVRLRAIDTVIALAQQTLFVVNARFEAERVIYSDVARAEVKLEDLFQQRLAAEQAIREASFSLAQLSGLELENHVLLVPTNTPAFTQPQFADEAIVNSAIASNPELRRQRQAIEIGRQTAFGAQNTLLPQLNLQAAHRTSGLEDDLGSSLQQMASYQFNDFTLGLQYTQQLGTRQARTQVTTAKLQIARERAVLEALERRVGFDILQELSKLKQTYQRYESALRQVEQSKKWVDIAQTRYEDPPVSEVQKESFLVTLVDYQTALQSQIDSIVLVANTLAEYNTALAVIDERRGILMAKWGIGTCSGEQQETVNIAPPQSQPTLSTSPQLQQQVQLQAQQLSSSERVPAIALRPAQLPPSPHGPPGKVFIPPLHGPPRYSKIE
jgi:outer membrane protein TolC